MEWGWIDLVSSIPMLDAFRWGRLVRVVRIMRALRGVRSVKAIVTVVFQTRAKGALVTMVFVALVLVTFASVTALHAENDSDSNIRSAGDAVWWSLTTMSTVGYGDRYPVTLEGRLIAAMLMFTGTALFCVFTAYVASWFVADPAGQNELASLRQEIKQLREHLLVEVTQRSGVDVEKS